MSPNLDRLVSHDDERAVLAGAFHDPAPLALVRPSDFASPAHRAICEAAQRAAARGAVTRETVRIELQRAAAVEHVAAAEALERLVPDLDGLPAVAARVRELAAGRATHAAALALVASLERGDLDDAREHVAAVTIADERRSVARSQSFGQAMFELVQSWDRGQSNLCPIGVGPLSEAIGGLERDGSLCVFGARTHVGKSYFGLTAVDGLLESGERPGLISAEDPSRLWAARALAATTRIPAERLRRGRVTAEERAAALAAAEHWRQRGGELVSMPGAPLEAVTAAMVHLVRERGCTVLLVDYLQAIAAPGRDSRQQTDRKLADMKATAARLGVPWILFSQLRRPDEMSKLWTEPHIAELKESGEIENRAEAILLGWRPAPTRTGEPQPPLLVRIAKAKGEPAAGGLEVLYRGPGWLWEPAPDDEAREWREQIDGERRQRAGRPGRGRFPTIGEAAQ